MPGSPPRQALPLPAGSPKREVAEAPTFFAAQVDQMRKMWEGPQQGAARKLNFDLAAPVITTPVLGYAFALPLPGEPTPLKKQTSLEDKEVPVATKGDMDKKWEKAVLANLSAYKKEDLNVAIVAAGGVAHKHERDVTKAAMELIRKGANLRVVPPLDYLGHFVGNMVGQMRRPVLEKLDIETLRFLAVRMGLVEQLGTALMKKGDLVEILVKAHPLLSIEEMHEMDWNQMSTFLRTKGIPFTHAGISKRAGSVDALRRIYKDYEEKLGHALPSKRYVPERVDMVRALAGKHAIEVARREAPKVVTIAPSSGMDKAVLVAYFKNFPRMQRNGYQGTKFMEQVDMVPVDSIDNTIDGIVKAVLGHEYVRRHENYGVYAIDYILNADDKALDLVLAGIGLPGLIGNWEQKLQIIWLMYISDRPLLDGAVEVAKTSTEKLLEVLPADFDPTMPRDRASVLWFFMTNTYPPTQKVVGTPAYNEATQRPGHVVSLLCKYLYRYYGEILSQQNPYRFLALVQERSSMEQFIESFTVAPVDTIVERTVRFMLFPPETTKASPDKDAYYLENLRHYDGIFKRKAKPSLPSKVDLQTKAGALAALGGFTDFELMEIYQFEGMMWRSRPHLLEQLAELASSKVPQWTLASNPKRCSNPTFSNLLQADREFGNESDPIISLGNLYGYRCYTMSELIGGFSAGDDGFTHFHNPLYNDPKNPRPDEYIDTLREFDTASVRQLRTLLVESKRAVFKELIENIDLGMTDASRIGVYVSTLQRTIAKLTTKEQIAFQHVVLQMFIQSMYARFWKGPGFPFPFKWVEGGAGEDTAHPRLEVVWQRDKNYSQADIKLRGLLTDAGAAVRELFESLTVVNYIWTSGTAYTTVDNYSKIATDASKSKMCLADMSDRGLQTAYFLMSRVFAWSEEQTNAQLREWIGSRTQSLFISTLVGVTNHVDPEHARNVIKE